MSLLLDLIQIFSKAGSYLEKLKESMNSKFIVVIKGETVLSTAIFQAEGVNYCPKLGT